MITCRYIIMHTPLPPPYSFLNWPHFERIVLADLPEKGLISNIYKILNAFPMQKQGKHVYMHKWEMAISEEMSSEAWQVIWSRAAKSSICILYKEHSYKVLYFWYLTPGLLHAIHLTTSARCLKLRQGSRFLEAHILALSTSWTILAVRPSIASMLIWFGFSLSSQSIPFRLAPSSL